MIASRKISVQAATVLLAAFAAVVLLAAMPSPAVAYNWSLPATDLSDGPNYGHGNPQVAVAADGTITVVWVHINSSNNIVQARTRPAGSNTFGAVESLTAPGGGSYGARVAVAADGTTTVVWNSNNIVQARTRPAGSSTFGSVEDLTATGQINSFPRVAVGVDGTTTVVWVRSDRAVVVQARTRPAGSRALVAQPARLKGGCTLTASQLEIRFLPKSQSPEGMPQAARTV